MWLHNNFEFHNMFLALFDKKLKDKNRLAIEDRHRDPRGIKLMGCRVCFFMKIDKMLFKFHCDLSNRSQNNNKSSLFQILSWRGSVE